jgi:hypothetical protein
LRDEDRGAEGGIVAKGRCSGAEQITGDRPNLPPSRLAKGQKGVEGGPVENGALPTDDSVKEAVSFEGGKIEDAVADGDADPGRGLCR